MARYQIDLAPHTLRAHGLRFCPLLQFYDSTHVARVADYRTLFGRGHFSRGDFIEDRLGQLQLAAVRAHGMSAHADYLGMWVLDDGEEQAAARDAMGRAARHRHRHRHRHRRPLPCR